MADALNAGGVAYARMDVHEISVSLLQEIVEGVSDAVTVIDRCGRYVYANPAALRLIGSPSLESFRDTPAGDLLGQFVLMDENGRPLTPDDLPARHLLRGESTEPVVVRYRVPGTGEERWTHLTARLVLDAQGEPAYVVNIFRDVTPERRIAQTRSYLAAIVESSDDAIFGKTLDAIITSWNRGAERLYGYTPEEAIGRPVHMLAPPDRMDDIPAIMARIRRGERVQHMETVRTRKDGTRVDVALTVSPIFDSEGSIIGASTVARDITERKRADAEHARLLRLAEMSAQRLAFLAEASNELASSLDYGKTLASVARLAVPQLGDWCAVHIVDEDGVVRQLATAHVDPKKVDLARQLEQRYPFDPDASVGAAAVIRTGQPELLREIPDELLIAVSPDEDLLQILRELGFRSSMVVPLAARDRVLGAITLVSAESGRLYGDDDLALGQDLANRAALAVDNARLYRQSEHLAAEQAAILEHMADAVILVGLDRRIEYMNRAAHELLGVDAEGWELDQLVESGVIASADNRPLTAEETTLARALAEGGVITMERHVHRPDGTDVVVQVSATPVVADGTQLGAVAVYHDVTAERELEREKEAFLSAAAHDLKTPLTSIKAVAQMLLMRARRSPTTDVERLMQGLQQIDGATTRMARLVEEMLDLSRIGMGQSLELNRRAVDLVDLLNREVTEWQRITENHRLTFSVDPADGGAICCECDVDRLNRVFSNLLSNAIKFSPAGGDIEVVISTDDGETGRDAVIRVRDSGLGIPPDDLPRIFDRFYRARNVEGRIQGTGIGLAGARHIVEQHGGRVTVESTEGEGTVFTVRLPLKATHGAEPTTEPTDAPA